MSVSKEPLNIRNNNPGNLRFVGQEGASQGEGGFAKFETPQAGLDAMRNQIELDTQKRGLNLTQFLNKYAPPSENKTTNYIDFVARKTGLDPSSPIPASAIPQLQAAMIEMEGGPRSMSYFTGTAAQATPAQAPRTTVQRTGLPASYRFALAANYLGDTEKDSVTEKAMQLMEEVYGEPGGGAGAFKKKLQSILAPREKEAGAFDVLAKAQTEEAPKGKAVPKMPKMFADGGEVGEQYESLEDVMAAAPTQDAEQRQWEQEIPVRELTRQLNETVDRYRAGRASEADVKQFFPNYSDYDIANMFGMTDAGQSGPRPEITAQPFLTPEVYDRAMNRGRMEEYNVEREIREKSPNIYPNKRDFTLQLQQLADGGEVKDSEFTEEERMKLLEQAQRLMSNMQYNLGPVNVGAIKKPSGYEARLAASISGVEPYMDIDPMSGRLSPTEYGVRYGQMGPQGGYELRYSQPVVPNANVPPQVSGQFVQPVGKNASVQASGFYVPVPGAKDAYGANLRYVQKFEDGGEVNYDQMAEQMTVGTLLPPEQYIPVPMVRPGVSVPTMSEVPRVDAQGRVIREAPTPDQVYTPGQKIIGGAEALGATLSGLTAPASILYDVARGVPAKEISPGRFMYEPRTEAGQEYTQNISRLAQDLKLDAALPQVQLQRPYPVGAMARQGIAALETGTEKMTLPVFRKITGNPDATKEQMMDFVLDQRSILEQGAPSIIKPKGGTFASSPAANVEMSFDIYNDSMRGRKATYSFVQGGEEMIKHIDAANDFINSKFKNYYLKKLGSQDDPLRDAFIRGEFKALDYFPNGRGDRSREVLADPDSTPDSKRVALKDLNQLYDMWADIEFISPGDKTREQVVDIIYKKLKEQGVEKIHPSDIQHVGNVRADPTVFGERGRLAEKQGDVVYDVASSALFRGRMMDLTDYLVTLNPNQIKNLTFEDAMIRAERFHEQMNNPVKKFTAEELFEGRDDWFKPNKKYQWTEIKTEEALRREGEAMGHCIKGDDYCLQLTSGVARHFSLQDAKTGEPHTTISIYRSPYNNKPDANHVIVEQIKGKSNSIANKYFSEIEAFLDDYEKRVGKIYVTEEEEHIPKLFRSEEYTKYPEGYRGNRFAKGGMVDKPLYDRAV
jgi:hypothetical protein